MPFTTMTAQGDGIGDGGSLEVQIEVRDVDDAPVETRSELCWITTAPTWDKPNGSELVLPPALLDVFVQALTRAIAEGRRTGMLPK